MSGDVKDIESKELEKDLAELEAASRKLETARKNAEALLQEKKAKRAEYIPVIQARVAEQDKIIADATAERARLMGQLKLFGMVIKGAAGTGEMGKRGSGKWGKMVELVTNSGIGAKLTNSDIYDYLGGAESGYNAQIVTKFLVSGWIKRTAPGEYEVVGIPT